MRIDTRLLVLALLPALPSAAQFFYPASASTRLHFAQLADGGAVTQKWTTTIAVANPDPLVPATITFSFYRDNGQALPLDFGGGQSSTLVVNLPAGGSKTLTSTGASSGTEAVVGWARALSNNPVYGTVIYRASANGVPVWDVAAAGTGAAYSYSSQAGWTLGVALANPHGTDTIHLRVSNRDGNGTPGADLNLTLPPLGHTAFTLGASVSGMPRSFQGTISIISTDSLPVPFVAWTLYERDGLLSPLPEGGMRFPAPISRRPKDVPTLLQAGAVTLVQAIGPDLFATSPEVVIAYVRQKGIALEESATLKATYETTDTACMSVGRWSRPWGARMQPWLSLSGTWWRQGTTLAAWPISTAGFPPPAHRALRLIRVC